ncbi:hypothetical protein LOZ45_006837 [Ophidiomyces ophidiicola]|nr:hypothetical protein LOZ56_006787 [Ophidiomyces ophidiicola]KAI2006898.1 hypothetical protein LOZ46_006807 [Ophidiomyces ophidiicola]KAI2014892.1 hypothetical protein LOZ45_006837 [Ophidiomyces ophidiicola]KAI2043324.1 hypothetical protein LOZ38_006705 [Ophidiomyces ophidiicola]KAI2096360.1 hypothetical protein LOZ34_006839 [Ophidiomyces ophidiicola]
MQPDLGKRRIRAREMRRLIKKTTLTDQQAHFILKEMEKSNSLHVQDPNLVGQFVTASWLTDEEAAEVLWMSIVNYICQVIDDHQCEKISLAQFSRLCVSIFRRWPSANHFTLAYENSTTSSVTCHLPIFGTRLTIDFNNLRPENGDVSILTPGSKLYSESNSVSQLSEMYGTLGFIITIDSAGDTKHVLATVSHVIGDSGRHLYVKSNGELLQLTTIPQCDRLGGRPKFRRDWLIDRPVLDEICFLDIPEMFASNFIPCVLGDVNCHELAGLPSNIADADIEIKRSPSAMNIDCFREWVKNNSPVEVHKIGASTGRTSGLLVEILHNRRGLKQKLPSRRRRRMANSSSSESSSSSSSSELDETPAYLLRIKWKNAYDSFSAPGDSGSLVFAEINRKIIPLGIHYGSDSDESYAYLLYSWFSEIELVLDCDAYFCNPAKCSSDIT